jgi:glycerophosphoryl diester phosphodiesterase
MQFDQDQGKAVMAVIRCFAIAAIALCCLVNGDVMASETTASETKASEIRPFDIEAHRGGRALFPENTLPSFANALSMGVNTLELDIGVTRDGAVVVSHERKLNPDLARGADGL